MWQIISSYMEYLSSHSVAFPGEMQLKALET